jgi:hypothetical protein
MLRSSTFAFLALLAALSLGLAACGGDDSGDLDDYESSIVETRDRVDTALAGISEAQTRADFSKRMEQASVVISRAADDLEEVEVADGFEDENTDLTEALRALSNDLEKTAEQLRLTPELFNTAEGLGFEGWTKANQILRGLGRQGIAVEPIANH